MNAKIFDLTLILEEELSVGVQLGDNLAAQKQALVAWDVDELVGQIDGREQWVRRLTELEEKRSQILTGISAAGPSLTLRQIIAGLPKESAERRRLFELREQVMNTFVQLQAEERILHMLMRNLQTHIQEALQPLGRPQAPTYGESGATEPHRPVTSLLHSRV